MTISIFELVAILIDENGVEKVVWV